MKKFSLIVLSSVLAIVSFGVPGLTQSRAEIDGKNEDLIELRKMTCRQVLKSDAEDRANILVFMHGYITGKQGEVTLNVPVLVSATEQIIDTCIDNPEETLLSVFEKTR